MTDLKHIFDNVLDIEHLDSYLTSISIGLIGNLFDASASELEEARSPGNPQLMQQRFID